MMFKRSRNMFMPTSGGPQPKSRRKDNGKNWTVDVLEEGDPLTKIKHHRLGTFFVGVPKKEFTVRVTIHPNAWSLHGATAYKCKLYLDEKEVAARYFEKPSNMYDIGDVTWEFNTLPTGHAFQFADRKGKKNDSKFTAKDKEVGKVRVTFQAAEEKFMSQFEEHFFGHEGNQKKNKEDEERTWDVAKQVKFDANQKDNFGTLKTTKGRMIREPRKSSGPRRGPRWNVNDYVYGEISLFYDSANHLEYRGILRPLHQKEHRYFFPDRDFSDQKSKKVAALLDLTGNRVVERKIKKGNMKNESNKRGGDSEWISVFDN